MRRSVEVLRNEWEMLRRACPDGTDEERIASLIERGLAVIERAHADGTPDDLPGGDRIARLRTAVVLKAAGVAVHRFDLVTQRDRLSAARREERATYERHLALHRDVVPPMKLQAMALREEVRRLEQEARSRGIDPDTIEPRIDWSGTISVDGYEPPRYESTDDRRRAAVEFFRRVGWR